MKIANEYKIYLRENDGRLEVTTSNKFPNYQRAIEKKNFLNDHSRRDDTSREFYDNSSESVKKSVDKLVQKLENHLKKNKINFNLNGDVFSSEVYLKNDFSTDKWVLENEYFLDEDSKKNFENFIKESKLFLKDYLKQYKIVSAISSFRGDGGF